LESPLSSATLLELARPLPATDRNYACAGSAVLVGLPSRRSPLWTIARAATVTATARRVTIRRAWW